MTVQMRQTHLLSDLTTIEYQGQTPVILARNDTPWRCVLPKQLLLHMRVANSNTVKPPLSAGAQV